MTGALKSGTVHSRDEMAGWEASDLSDPTDSQKKSSKKSKGKTLVCIQVFSLLSVFSLLPPEYIGGSGIISSLHSIWQFAVAFTTLLELKTNSNIWCSFVSIAGEFLVQNLLKGI